MFGITQSVVDEIGQENYARLTTGRQTLTEPTLGADLAQYAADLYLSGNSDLGLKYAEVAGVSREQFLTDVARINLEAQARRRSGFNPLQSALASQSERMDENPLAAIAALWAVGFGTSFLGGAGAGAGAGSASATVSSSITSAGIAGTAAAGAIPAGIATAGAGVGVATGAVTAANVGGAVAAGGGWFSWLNAGANLALGVKQASDARKAGDRAEEQEQAATDERVRRLELERGRILGTQRAGAAAGGVRVSSPSVLAVQAETIDEIEREIRFVRQAGAFAAEAAELRGRQVAYQGLSTALTGAGQIFRIVNSRRNPETVAV